MKQIQITQEDTKLIEKALDFYINAVSTYLRNLSTLTTHASEWEECEKAMDLRDKMREGIYENNSED